MSAADTKGSQLAWALARSATGFIMFYHGSQKALGIFGGNGFAATLEGFQTHLNIPPILGVCAILSEFLGGLGLFVGGLTRLAGFGVFTTMFVAMMVNINGADGLGNVFGPEGDPTKVFYTGLMTLIGLGALLGGGGKYSADAALNLESKIPFLKPKPTTPDPN